MRVRADDIHIFGGYSDALHLLHALTVHGVTRMAVEDPCNRHLRQMRQRYRKRRLLLQMTISTIPTFRLIGAAAGLHLTVVLAPGGPDEAAVVRAGLDASLTLWSLSHHFAPQTSAHVGGGSTEGIVLGFSRSSDAAFMRALRDLPHVMAAAVTRSAN